MGSGGDGPRPAHRLAHAGAEGEAFGGVGPSSLKGGGEVEAGSGDGGGLGFGVAGEGVEAVLSVQGVSAQNPIGGPVKLLEVAGGVGTKGANNCRGPSSINSGLKIKKPPISFNLGSFKKLFLEGGRAKQKNMIMRMQTIGSKCHLRGWG